MQEMRVAIGADHAGYPMKRELAEHLKGLGHEVLDLGSYGPEPSDYPIYSEAVGIAVLKGRADRGVLICGSGVGATVAANKLAGIRACLCHDPYSARQGVEHDDMNVLSLGARVIGTDLAKELVRIFLEAKFSGAERHRRRLGEIEALESRYLNREGTDEGDTKAVT